MTHDRRPIMLSILLFGLGVALGAWWFTVIVLPLLYGFPRAVYWVFRGAVKPAAAIRYLGTVILWTAVFVFAAFVLLTVRPSAATYLYNSAAFFYGQWFGVGGSLVYALTSKGRADLRADFAAVMLRSVRTDRPQARQQFEEILRTTGDPRAPS
jgi:hypothetical protein